jgi:hypothetical protein
MTQILKMRPPPDEIDGLVDGVLADPSRADELKRLLRTRLRVVQGTAPDEADDHDLWENVPV